MLGQCWGVEGWSPRVLGPLVSRRAGGAVGAVGSRTAWLGLCGSGRRALSTRSGSLSDGMATRVALTVFPFTGAGNPGWHRARGTATLVAMLKI